MTELFIIIGSVLGAVLIGYLWENRKPADPKPPKPIKAAESHWEIDYQSSEKPTVSRYDFRIPRGLLGWIAAILVFILGQLIFQRIIDIIEFNPARLSAVPAIIFFLVRLWGFVWLSKLVYRLIRGTRVSHESKT